MSIQEHLKTNSNIPIVKTHQKRTHNTYEFKTYLNPAWFKFWKILDSKNGVFSYVHLHNRMLSLRTYGISTREIKSDELYHVSISVKVRDRQGTGPTPKLHVVRPSDPVGVQITIRNEKNSKEFNSLPLSGLSIFNGLTFLNSYDFSNTLNVILLKPTQRRRKLFNQLIHLYTPQGDSFVDPNNSKYIKETITHDFLTYIDPKICNNISLLSLNRNGVKYCFNNNSNIIINSYVGDLSERFHDDHPVLCRIKLTPKYFTVNETKMSNYEKIYISLHYPDQSKGDFENLPFRIMTLSILNKNIQSFNKNTDRYIQNLILISPNTYESTENIIYMLRISSKVSESEVKNKYNYAKNYTPEIWNHYNFNK